jgi:hypothetical protein
LRMTESSLTSLYANTSMEYEPFFSRSRPFIAVFGFRRISPVVLFSVK